MNRLWNILARKTPSSLHKKNSSAQKVEKKRKDNLIDKPASFEAGLYHFVTVTFFKENKR